MYIYKHMYIRKHIYIRLWIIKKKNTHTNDINKSRKKKIVCMAM